MKLIKQSKMALKFAANITTMFKEHANVLDRYQAAKLAGFKGVEFTFLYELPVEAIVEAKLKSGLEQVLINSYPGNLAANELGKAALPSCVKEFEESLELSIKYCKALDCKRLHIMAGRSTPGIIDAGMGPVYLENLKHAAQRLTKEGIVGVIEPINSYTIPGYFLNSFKQATEVLDKVNSPNLKLQLDMFHLQHICGSLTNRIKELLPYIGHIQIAQVPDRHEPDSEGEINYDYIFKLLESLGYDGWIGCEYVPKGDTVEGLKWFQRYTAQKTSKN